MTVRRSGTEGRNGLRLCLWCVLAVAVEVALFSSYRGHDAKFHWFTHFFVGASMALLAMAGVALRTRRPVPVPLVWPLAGHLFAMLPDVLFNVGIAHQRWMDLFLGHISSHFVPGRNLTWYVVFLACLAAYLAAVFHVGERQDRSTGAPER
ncbi:MAG TPA: hypothetical protein VGV63_06860 [Acidimicrobiales bacterium]|nr:hypothetical protein [Acidimicrobiales bacterium]